VYPSVHTSSLGNVHCNESLVWSEISGFCDTNIRSPVGFLPVILLLPCVMEPAALDQQNQPFPCILIIRRWYRFRVDQFRALDLGLSGSWAGYLSLICTMWASCSRVSSDSPWTSTWSRGTSQCSLGVIWGWHWHWFLPLHSYRLTYCPQCQLGLGLHHGSRLFITGYSSLLSSLQVHLFIMLKLLYFSSLPLSLDMIPRPLLLLLYHTACPGIIRRHQDPPHSCVYIIKYCVYACICVCTCHSVCVWRSEDTLWESLSIMWVLGIKLSLIEAEQMAVLCSS